MIAAKIQRNDLLQGLQAVIGATAPRTTIPVLGCILLRFGPAECCLSATDLDIWASATVPCETEADGAIAVNAHRLQKAVKALPLGCEIEVKQAEPRQLTLSANGAVFKFYCPVAEDFPNPPEITTDPCTEIPLAQLRLMCRKTAYAVAERATRFQLQGALLSFEAVEIPEIVGNASFISAKVKAQLVATDGHQLAAVSGSASRLPVVREQLIPGKALRLLADWNASGVTRDSSGRFISRKSPEAMQPEGLVKFSRDNSRRPASFVRFEWKNLTLSTRIPEGNFPQWQRFLSPRSGAQTIVFDREDLIAKIKRVMVMGGSNVARGMKMLFKEGEARLSVSHVHEGEAEESFPISYSGEPTLVGFNPEYLLEWLRVSGTERVSFEIESPGDYAVGKAIGSALSDDMMVLMPLRV